MEGVTKAGLFSFLGGESLDGLQIKVVVQVKIVQILPMDQKHQHVETLPANL